MRRAGIVKVVQSKCNGIEFWNRENSQDGGRRRLKAYARTDSQPLNAVAKRIEQVVDTYTEGRESSVLRLTAEHGASPALIASLFLRVVFLR